MARMHSHWPKIGGAHSRRDPRRSSSVTPMLRCYEGEEKSHTYLDLPFPFPLNKNTKPSLSLRLLVVVVVVVVVVLVVVVVA